jgi:hypothetical protein
MQNSVITRVDQAQTSADEEEIAPLAMLGEDECVRIESNGLFATRRVPAPRRLPEIRRYYR